MLTEIGSYIPDDSLYHPTIDMHGNISFKIWKTPGDLGDFGSPKNPERLQEWAFRRNAPEIYCKMSKSKLKFEIEPDTEDLAYYSEAKDITDRLNNNSAEITKLYKQLKTEFTQAWKQSRAFK